VKQGMDAYAEKMREQAERFLRGLSKILCQRGFLGVR